MDQQVVLAIGEARPAHELRMGAARVAVLVVAAFVVIVPVTPEVEVGVIVAL